MSTTSPASQLGEQIGDGVLLFRAFAEKNFRERKATPPHTVRYGAYLLRAEDVADGLSVGLTPEASVKNLARNEGYCSVPSGAVYSMQDGLSVRLDDADSNHAFICNLPLLTDSDDARHDAIRIAKALARASTVVTCNPFVPEANQSTHK